MLDKVSTRQPETHYSQLKEILCDGAVQPIRLSSSLHSCTGSRTGLINFCLMNLTLWYMTPGIDDCHVLLIIIYIKVALASVQSISWRSALWTEQTLTMLHAPLLEMLRLCCLALAATPNFPFLHVALLLVLYWVKLNITWNSPSVSWLLLLFCNSFVK